ncbi:MAG: DUF2268 domain-containing putative Zn-dependent protease, partial [Gemmatimonadaceae bacterium]
DAANSAPGQSFYDAADAYLAAGMIDASISALDSAVRAGYHDSAGLKDDTALVALHADPRWSNVVTGVVRNEKRFRKVHSDPNRVLISTADITRFWTAYDLAAKEPTIDARSGVYLREYVEPGSRGLHDFYAKKIRSSKRLAEAVDKYPRFYASMRGPASHLSNLAPTIRSVFRRMKQLYPETIYPDIYFVMGRISSAGTVADYGLLFGAEQNVASAGTPVDELPLALQRIVYQRADLPHTIAHELVHFQQHLADKHTLLDVALIEGGATFLSDLAVPDRPPPYFLTWGAAHERQVWTAFARVMEHDDVSQWIGNNGTTSRPDWPADLGYFVGYQISKAYYERASNKRDAIRDLIVLRDSEAILRGSHYASTFR